MNMSSKTQPTKANDLHAIPSQEPGTGEVLRANGARTEEIRRRAYEIYLERGEQPGRDLDDWLQAECELEGGVLSLTQAS
jgi:Protein of unknown function (DUF2934)